MAEDFAMLSELLKRFCITNEVTITHNGRWLVSRLCATAKLLGTHIRANLIDAHSSAIMQQNIGGMQWRKDGREEACTTD